MCGGFTCSKNALIALNILYIVVGFVLISVSIYGRASAIITNLPIVGGIFACGFFLIFIAALGLVGAVKHHQVILFFYMVILFILFLVQFGFATACLTVTSQQQQELAIQGWKSVKQSTKAEVQVMLGCCGFDNREYNSTDPMGHPPCTFDCCTINKDCMCPPCIDKLQNTMNYAFDLCGGLGLFFSFTEVISLVVTYRYRNQFYCRGKYEELIVFQHRRVMVNDSVNSHIRTLIESMMFQNRVPDSIKYDFDEIPSN